jgi:hypothetical protein
MRSTRSLLAPDSPASCDNLDVTLLIPLPPTAEVRALSPAPGAGPSGLRARVRVLRPEVRPRHNTTSALEQIFFTDQFPLPRKGELLHLPDGTEALVVASQETLADGLWEHIAYI